MFFPCPCSFMQHHRSVVGCTGGDLYVFCEQIQVHSLNARVHLKRVGEVPGPGLDLDWTEVDKQYKKFVAETHPSLQLKRGLVRPLGPEKLERNRRNPN